MNNVDERQISPLQMQAEPNDLEEKRDNDENENQEEMINNSSKQHERKKKEGPKFFYETMFTAFSKN